MRFKTKIIKNVNPITKNKKIKLCKSKDKIIPNKI